MDIVERLRDASQEATVRSYSMPKAKSMTCEELIRELSKLPGDMPVAVYDREGLCTLKHVQTDDIRPVEGFGGMPGVWDGEAYHVGVFVSLLP